MTTFGASALAGPLERRIASRAQDPGLRAGGSAFALEAAGIFADFGKARLDDALLADLCALADMRGVARRRDAMLAGEAINSTEGRAVLHTALRLPAGRGLTVDGSDIANDIQDVLAAMGRFADQVRSGAIAGKGGAFTDIVNIGIGGSDLGPAMVARALSPYCDGPRTHFVSNVDPAHLSDTLERLDLSRTLFLIVSKTFTTAETLANARAARQRVVDALGETAVGDHFAAISTALDKVGAFGIAADRIFGFWDWVGGRYSVWSAVGLSVMLAIGPARFADFLAGAHAMDRHFAEAPIAANLPMVLGLVGYFQRSQCGHGARAVLPYDQRLALLPAYLQQLDMESNGKRVALDGTPVSEATGPIVWGEPGTNGQHAFFQLLHQGTDIVPCEFLIAAQTHEAGMADQHAMLVANCLAQSRALLEGRSSEAAHAQFVAAGRSDEEARSLAPHRTFPGGRPSVTLLYKRLDPATLGAVIALYEHRVFVEGAMWGINSFDQWGVELGKEMASSLMPSITADAPLASEAALDGSTRRLLARLRAFRDQP